ncbi:MAG: hypothetical protein JOZ81_17695 [Chloroflexi bacterium]|nr:hypothetical protein [Chloroflexota bacterium]
MIFTTRLTPRADGAVDASQLLGAYRWTDQASGRFGRWMVREKGMLDSGFLGG